MTLEEARAIVVLLDDPGTDHITDCGTYDADGDPGGEWYQTATGQRISLAEAAAARAMLAAAELLAQQQHEQRERTRPGPKLSPAMKAAIAESQQLEATGLSKNAAARIAAEHHGVTEDTLRDHRKERGWGN